MKTIQKVKATPKEAMNSTMNVSDVSKSTSNPIANVAAGTSLPRDPPAYPRCRTLSRRPEVDGTTPDHEGAGPSISSQTRQVLGESQGTGLLLENVEERHSLRVDKDGKVPVKVNADCG